MMKLNPLLRAMLEDMQSYPTRDNVLPKYQIALQEINLIINKIRQCEGLSCANDYFDQLLEVQTALSVLVYKEKIDEYSSINRFVSDFDRADDARERAYLFDKITKEQLKY